MTLGGVVRVTDSGLGCPDWPLCHGQVIPPFDTATLIEYSHRLSGSVLGLLVIASATIVWMRLRSNRVALTASVVALVLVVAAGILGGITVLTELDPRFVLLHLAIAEAMIACLIFAAIAGWNFGSEAIANGHEQASEVKPFIIASIAGAFILILSGSYMVGSGYGTSCATWPLCRGSFMPEGMAYAIHMGHRYVAALVGVVIVWTAWKAWSSASAQSAVRTTAACVAASFAVQTVVGALVVWSGFSADLKATHLSLATLVWMGLATLAGLIYSYRPASGMVKTVMVQKAM